MTDEKITVLLPVLDQKERFLSEAVESLLNQSSARWRLCVVLDTKTPPWIREWFKKLEDERIEVVTCEREGLGAALNDGMRHADTPFVSILLSDDRYHPRAIETLLRARRRHPGADFLHSARRYIGPDGEPISEVMPSKTFDRSHFADAGSPVKHLMCWRRDLALDIGGMREHLGAHGCDDFDFPWRMAEADASFLPIPECLYDYRVHTEGPRLTTDTELQEQIDILETMFREHGVDDPRLTAFLDRAVDSYLPVEHFGRMEPQRAPHISCHRDAGPERAPDFLNHGLPTRHFFPHRVYVVRRPGPDGLQYAEAMCQVRHPEALRQLLLFGLPEATDEFPENLFFDDDIQWHQQHLGLIGHIAHANLVLSGGDIYVTLAQSDLVQRIGRRRDLKTRIEGTFKGWAHLVLNSVLDYAIDRGARAVYWPTAAQVGKHTDLSRKVRPELFERVYDATPNFRHEPQPDGEWWRFDIDSVSNGVVKLDRRLSVHRRQPTICIVHDIERGLGHAEAEPAFVGEAERVSPRAFEEMLRAEANAGVKATYNVVGQLVPELRGQIEAGGHALAFHSYQHAIWKPYGLRRRIQDRFGDPEARFQRSRDGVDYGELLLCRGVDYRLKGYRPPQSRITPGLHDRHLALQNFEWFASSSHWFDEETPWLENGIVKIPVHIDDFDLHRGIVDYSGWEKQVNDLLDRLEIVVIGLHDCYGPTWLPHYDRLLERLKTVGTLRTCDELAATVVLGAARWR